MITETNKAFAAYLLQEVAGLCEAEVYDTLDSTNNRARQYAEQMADGNAVILARTQTAGRGRFDRCFVSPEGCGLYLSYVVKPAKGIAPAALTTCAAVAVCEAVEALTGDTVTIKWVNDLWMNERKICGILTEGKFLSDGTLAYAVIGIGLNVLHADFPEDLKSIATSIEDATGKRLDLRPVAATVLNTLRARLEGCAEGAHMDAYRTRSALDGRTVTVCRGDERYDAVVRGIGDDGELLLTLPDGQETALSSGEVVSVRARTEGT